MKQVTGFPRYLISDDGKLFSSCLRMFRERKCVDNGPGYLCVPLHDCGKQKMKLIHRLVAEAFVENPHNHEYVNHIDGNKYNNVASNLEWCDCKHNMAHASKLGLLEQGSERYNSKLTEAEAQEIRESKDKGVSLAKKYRVSTALISRIRNGKQRKLVKK